MNELIACHECDLIHRAPAVPAGSTAKCVRCGAVLLRHKRNSLDRSLALTIAGTILFVVCNLNPFMAMKSGGIVQETTLVSGIVEFYRADFRLLACLVFVTIVAGPAVQLAGMLYLLLVLKLNRKPWLLSTVFRFLQAIRPWGMLEIFMLGVLVSMVKLAKMATIVPGIAMYAFAALIPVLVASATSLDPNLIWERLQPTDER